MTLDYAQHLLVSYAANLARWIGSPGKSSAQWDTAQAFAEEVAAGESFAAIRAAAETSPHLDSLFRQRADGRKNRRKAGGRGSHAPRAGGRFEEPRQWLADEQDWQALRASLEALQRITAEIPPNLPARRLRALAGLLALSEADMRILEVFVFQEHSRAVCSLLNFTMEHCSGSELLRRRMGVDRALFVSRLLGMPWEQFRARLRHDAPLVSQGLLEVDRDLDFSLLGRLRRLYWDTDESTDLRDLLLGAPRAVTELDWSDFEHLGQGRDDLEAILRGAMRLGGRGVNVLLYGPPGTGKTAFAKALASRAGLCLYSVGESDSDDGGEPLRGARLAELSLAHKLLEKDRLAALLLDEMDDILEPGGAPLLALFGGAGRARMNGRSRVYLHRLLENAPVPTLWTTNHADCIDPAILRRMTFALDLRLPPPRVRARIWSRQLARHGLRVSAEQARVLAEEFAASPGVSEGAVVAGRLGAGDIELVRRSARSLNRAMGCERPPRGRRAVAFDPALLNADTDPAGLAERLAGSGERRVSLCLQGPPGTGKSAYARYLAERMGLEVLHRRASDLLGCLVGETERNIAEAFAQARAGEAFLVFDEADSLLAEREGAHRSWEVSQVNEMLTWMESHPLPFACTTNRGKLLDSAALRRFVFKVALGYCNLAQAQAAFRAWFAMAPPAELAALDALTPGDFEVVRRKAEVLGQLADAGTLLEMLRAECAAKPGRSAPIGFACA